MADEQATAPDSTAVRVALWRAMHVQVDPPPHVLEDEIGLELAAPGSWWEQLPAAGFDAGQPAVAASTGVSMYLTKEANAATLRQLAALAPGSTVAMTFQLPLELLDEEDRPGRLATVKGSRAAGTPWLSFFTPRELLALARDSGFKDVKHVPATTLNQRYFAARTDGLRTSSIEEILVATT